MRRRSSHALIVPSSSWPALLPADGDGLSFALDERIVMSGTPTRAQPKPKSKPWTRPNPKPRAARTRLSTAQKDAAQQRADEHGRRYPNLVDNMWASRHLAKDGSPKA
ncbi:hypothetical protein FHW73_000936 [Luteimonas sp. RC10]|jgi:hypothetical protein|nr:hypothetical protein [Luteimonas sp. RC10]